MWLTISFAEWFFDAVRQEGTDPLSFIPKIGVVALVAGAILGLIRRQTGLALFVLPILAIHLFVAIAGILERSFAYPSNNSIPVVAFLLGELAASLYLIFRLKGARISALLIAIFTMSYALFAAFIGAMALSGDWL